MTYRAFLKSLQGDRFPQHDYNYVLRALWYDAKGHWHRAQRIAQDDRSAAGAWVNAYLHRKGGDHINADAWYARAGKLRPEMSFQDEWDQLVRAFTR